MQAKSGLQRPSHSDHLERKGSAQVSSLILATFNQNWLWGTNSMECSLHTEWEENVQTTLATIFYISIPLRNCSLHIPPTTTPHSLPRHNKTNRNNTKSLYLTRTKLLRVTRNYHRVWRYFGLCNPWYSWALPAITPRANPLESTLLTGSLSTPSKQVSAQELNLLTEKTEMTNALNSQHTKKYLWKL